MKATIINEYGDAENFTVTDIPIPEVTPRHVLVKVDATSLNQVDLLTRSLGAPLAPDLPAVLHSDVAGTVAMVGEGVADFQIGDEVYGCVGGVAGTQGTLAEFVLADADLLAKKPQSLDMVQSAALPLVSITAWQAVFERAKLEPGQTVLVYGGAGGVGHLVVQLAKYVGATVVATASSPDKAAVARDCGADAVVDYKNTSLETIIKDHTHGNGFDVVIDTVGGANLTKSFEAAKLGGTVVTTIALGPVDLTQAHMRALSLHVVFMLVPLLHGVERAPHGEILREIATLADAGKLRPVLDAQRFLISDAAKAHEHMESGAHIGKIVLTQS